MGKLTRLSVLLLVVAATLAVLPSGPAWATTLTNGDVNHDGATNSIDAALVLQRSAGLLPSAGIDGDVNLDGAVNSVDATLILQYGAGLLPARVTASGLKIIDLVVGDGQEVVAGNSVTVNYTGWLTNGTMFDSSYQHGGPAQFPLNAVIAGWREGVPGMKVGGKRRLIIPPELAYGHQGAGSVIPPDATLIFDVELISIP